MDDYLWVLKKDELDLMREVEPARIEKLDEDGLLVLHKRMRRARNKHVKNYRRRGAKAVAQEKARGAARPKGSKERLRAEAFEEALSLVSARLAIVAHEAAEALKAERLALAQQGRWSGPGTTMPAGGRVDDEGRTRSHVKSTGGVKRDASSRAQGARRQAARDSK